MALRYSGDAFSYFDTPNEFRQPPAFRSLNNPDVYTAGILDPEFLRYLEASIFRALKFPPCLSSHYLKQFQYFVLDCYFQYFS